MSRDIDEDYERWFGIMRDYYKAHNPMEIKYTEDENLMNTEKLTSTELILSRVNDLYSHFQKYHLPIDKSDLRNINTIVSYRVYHEDKPYTNEIGIIMGYAYSGSNKYYFSVREVIDLYTSEFRKNNWSSSDDIQYIIKRISTPAKSVDKIGIGYISRLEGGSSLQTRLPLLPVKIKSTALSGKVFGLSKSKKEIEGQVITKYSINYGESRQLGASTYYAEIPVGTRSLKFCLNDLEFILPTLKGYTAPKDKTIKLGSRVKLIKNKNNRKLPIGLELEVIDIKPNLNSKKISKNSRTKQLDIVVCRAGNKNIRIYAKNLKPIL